MVGSTLDVNESSASMLIGTVVFDELGNAYRYVKANEALAIGQCVTAVPWAAWDSGIAVDGAITDTTVSLIHIDTITTAMTVNQYAGYYIRQGEAAGLGRSQRIYSHAAMAISGEGDLNFEAAVGEAYANDVALLIFNPFLVELVDGDTEQIQGVAVGTITSGYFGWIQIAGYVPAVAIGHSTSAAIVLNEPLVPVAGVPGSCQGMAGNAEGDIMEAACSPLMALDSANADTTGYMPAFMKRSV